MSWWSPTDNYCHTPPRKSHTTVWFSFKLKFKKLHYKLIFKNYKLVGDLQRKSPTSWNFFNNNTTNLFVIFLENHKPPCIFHHVVCDFLRKSPSTLYFSPSKSIKKSQKNQFYYKLVCDFLGKSPTTL